MPLYIGVMSGTSLDGIDLVLMDWNEQAQTRATHFVAMPPDLRDALLGLCSPGPDELRLAALADHAWVNLVADGIQELLRLSEVKPSAVRAIGCHGQTVRHEPQLGFTWQLGDPNQLAERCGIDVIADFRRRDMAAGGQGAPLVPAFHQALFGHLPQPLAILNIGGFSNLSLLQTDASLGGFDCGPGNALLDAWIHRHLGRAYDENGRWAASGKVNHALLERMLADPFFALVGPKSTGREHFNLAWLDKQLAVLPGLQAADVQASLLELTARCCSDALQRAQTDTQQLVVCGGGAHNGKLLERLAALTHCPVHTSDALGIPCDWIEAAAFAWLAHCFLEDLPGNRPEVTGARGLRRLGGWYPA